MVKSANCKVVQFIILPGVTPICVSRLNLKSYLTEFSTGTDMSDMELSTVLTFEMLPWIHNSM